MMHGLYDGFRRLHAPRLQLLDALLQVQYHSFELIVVHLVLLSPSMASPYSWLDGSLKRPYRPCSPRPFRLFSHVSASPAVR